MKRAFLRKVKPVSCPNRETAGQTEQAPSGVHRKAVAMFGLALSVGATSLVLPHREDSVSAAEASSAEATAPTVSQVAALPQPAAAIDAANLTLVEHVVREGQTLMQIARSYRVNIEAISTANRLDVNAPLKPGQILRIPVVGSTTGTTDNPALVASAELNQQPSVVQSPALVTPADAAAAERDAALGRLRQQREKLRANLAELRSGGVNHSVEAPVVPIAENPPASSATSLITEPPRVDPTQPIAANQLPQKPEAASYRVQPGDTLTTIARTHGVSEQQLIATNRLPDPDWIRVSQSLNIPNAVPNAQASSSPVRAPGASTTQVAEAQPSAPTQPAASTQVAAAAPSVEEYRVSPGDTLARIARAHNIPQATLIRENRISNPNVIFVGQTLQVPSVRPAAPDTQAVPQPVAVVPTAIAPVEQQGNLVQPASEQANSTTPAAQANTDPRYVENLLAEVRALREKHEGSLGTGGAVPQQPIAVARRDTSTRAEQLAASNRTNPLTQARQNQPESQPDVVAAAPLGSESYAPLRQPLTGRSVSPELPPLPGADAYLPEGSRSSNGYMWPAKGMLSSGYGWRWGRMHQGIDIAADVGTPIYAAADGVIEFSDWNSGGYGNLVEIRHGDGSMTRYAHLNRSLVQEGQRVRQGEQIGEMGSTGYSTGPHLHFEVHPSGQGAANPMAYLPAEQNAQ